MGSKHNPGNGTKGEGHLSLYLIVQSVYTHRISPRIPDKDAGAGGVGLPVSEYGNIQ